MLLNGSANVRQQEKFMDKIAKNYIYNLLYQLLIIIVPLITAPYLARVLGPTNVGVYGYIHSTTTLINMIVLLGIYGYGNRQIAYIRDNPLLVDTIFWEIMSARLVIAVFGTIVYFTAILIVNKYVYLFVIYYMYLLAYFLDCTWLYVGMEDMKWAVLKNTITKVVSVIGIFIFVRNETDLWKYVSIQAGSLLVSNLLAYSQLKQYVKRPKIIMTHLSEHLKQSFLLFLPSAASAVYLQCDKIMIELMTGNSAEVSYYDYSEKLITIPLTFITVLSTVMMPRIANEYFKGNKLAVNCLLNRAAKFSVFLACPMMFGIIAIANKLIPWYLGSEFNGTIIAMSIISPIILCNTLTGISGNQYFTATNQIQILLKAQISAAILNVIINALTIPQIGFIGAAMATVISSFINAIVQYYYLVRQVKLPGFSKSLLRHLIMSFIMYCVITVITRHMIASPMTSMVQVFVGIIVYLFLAVILRDPELLEGVKMVKSKLKGDEVNENAR